MSARWENQRERGSFLAMRLLIGFALALGRPVGRWLLLPPVVAYFLATSASSRRASRQFLQRALPRAPGFVDVLRHFYSFAACTLDRAYLLSGRLERFSVVSHRPPEVAAVAERRVGCLLMVAHFGNSDALRVLGVDRHKLNLAILMDRRHGQMITALLERLNPALAIDVIDAAQRGPQLVLSLKDALDRGRMVGVMADRAREDEPRIAVQFMGATARLPAGPWILAGALGVPVILGFGVHRGGNRYDSYFELLTERAELPRHERDAAVQNLAQRYAWRLEHYARLAPYNWFNFYDFWADEAAPH